MLSTRSRLVSVQPPHLLDQRGHISGEEQTANGSRHDALVTVSNKFGLSAADAQPRTVTGNLSVTELTADTEAAAILLTQVKVFPRSKV